MDQERQMSQSMPLAILLTLAGGFQDAYSYNSRGHVFANAQTGNIVLFAQNLMSAQFSQALHYLLPVLAFILGVYISEKIHQKYKYSHLFHWRQLVLVSEIFLLILAGFLKTDMIANILLSFAKAQPKTKTEAHRQTGVLKIVMARTSFRKLTGGHYSGAAAKIQL